MKQIRRTLKPKFQMLTDVSTLFHALPHLTSNKSPNLWWDSVTKLLFLLVFLFGYCSSSQANDTGHYRFSADDQISITVFGEPDLSLAKIRITTDGTISVPLIGQVRVQGLTAAEITEELTRLFANDYLKNPAITVSVIEYRQFYINGEVKKPGGYSFRDGLTVERAVALAGGFSERAAKNKITIAHEENTNKIIRVELTTPIKPGDIITVKESFF